MMSNKDAIQKIKDLNKAIKLELGKEPKAPAPVKSIPTPANSNATLLARISFLENEQKKLNEKIDAMVKGNQQILQFLNEETPEQKRQREQKEWFDEQATRKDRMIKKYGGK